MADCLVVVCYRLVEPVRYRQTSYGVFFYDVSWWVVPGLRLVGHRLVVVLHQLEVVVFSAVAVVCFVDFGRLDLVGNPVDCDRLVVCDSDSEPVAGHHVVPVLPGYDRCPLW